MVYESDFYTSRRPYRPSSYSVTTTYSVPLRYITLPSIGKVHGVSSFYPTYNRSERLVQSRIPPHRVVAIKVRPSVVIRELDRIEHRSRPSVGYSASENYFNSESSKTWEDESRKIRAQTQSLLQRINNPVPRATSVVPYTTVARYNDPFKSSKLSCDDFIKNMMAPVRNVASNIMNLSWYAEPVKRFTGRGNLSCVRYSGAKAFPNRKPLYQDFSIKDDVTLLSFYVKNRLAAVGLALESATVKLLPWRASRKFQPIALMEDPAIELKAQKAERLQRFKAIDVAPIDNAAEADRLAERKKKRQEEANMVEERALAEEMMRKKEQTKRDEAARAAELARQEQLAAQAAAERAAELERKAEITRKAEMEKQAAEEAAQLAEQDRLAEEARISEEARLAEEAKLAAEAKLAEEARLAEAARLAEEAKLAEEARQAAEEERRQKELTRLAEIEKSASEDQEAELARQAAELAELARQEAELAALAKQEAELAEQQQQEAAVAEEAAVEPEAAVEEAEAEPIVEEPVTPDVQNDEDAPVIEEVSDSQNAEGDITEEE